MNWLLPERWGRISITEILVSEDSVIRDLATIREPKGGARSAGLTGRHSIALLTWLLQNDLLCEYSPRFFGWLTSLDEAAHPFDVDGYLDDIESSDEKIQIGEYSVDVEKLAACLCEVHGSVLLGEGRGEVLEALSLAESLGAWTDREQSQLTSDSGEIFLSNWKFAKSMQVDVAPMLAFVAHLRDPQILPDTLTYRQLLLAIEKSIGRKGAPIDLVISRLNRSGIAIKRALLTSVIRNEGRYLLVHDSTALCVARADEVLIAWRLAEELIEPCEYLRATGLAFDGKAYWQAGYSVDSSRLRKFFDLHQSAIDWTQLDPVEIALKLSHGHSIAKPLIQGMPPAVHEFIVRWITKSGRIWRTTEAERLLGHRFEFDPADVSPGRLMVYGNANSGRIGSGALVVREMVSKVTQARGQIHPSRVLTPFDDVVINADAQVVQAIVRAQHGYTEWGITHIDDLAEQLLRARGHRTLPYTLKLAREACLAWLPETMRDIGRGLLLSEDRHGVVAGASTAEQKRKCFVGHLLDSGLSRNQFSESLSVRVANALLG